MTFIRNIAIAAVIAAATGAALVSQQAVAAARWGSAVDVLKDVMPTSTEVAAKFKFGNISDLIMPSSMEARRRFGGA
jgi:hypothetical protein